MVVNCLIESFYGKMATKWLTCENSFCLFCLIFILITVVVLKDLMVILEYQIPFSLSTRYVNLIRFALRMADTLRPRGTWW